MVAVSFCSHSHQFFFRFEKKLSYFNFVNRTLTFMKPNLFLMAVILRMNGFFRAKLFFNWHLTNDHFMGAFCGTALQIPAMEGNIGKELTHDVVIVLLANIHNPLFRWCDLNLTQIRIHLHAGGFKLNSTQNQACFLTITFFKPISDPKIITFRFELKQKFLRYIIFLEGSES